MATLYISEHAVPVRPGVLEQPSVATQTVAIGGTSTQSSAFSNKTGAVILSTDAICSVAFGANPTATAATLRMPASTSLTFTVTPGHKVAVITNT